MEFLDLQIDCNVAMLATVMTVHIPEPAVVGSVWHLPTVTALHLRFGDSVSEALPL